MLHRFDSSGRMALGALSYLNVETRNRSLLVQAFHTFPDDYELAGTRREVQLQVGNAVPPELARVIVREMAEQLEPALAQGRRRARRA